MKACYRLFLAATLLFVAACSQSTNPTRPTPLTAQPENVLSLGAAMQVVDWATLTSSRDDAGIIGAPDAPTAPANLAFTVSGSTVVLTWSAPASGNATSYVLEAGTSAGSSNIVSFNTGSSATTFTATGVPNGTYFVRVRARNADGTSGASNEVTIVIGAGGTPCPTPAAPTGFSAAATGNSVTLTWNPVPGALSFIIEAGTAPGATNIITVDTGSAATMFAGNAPNGTYYLRVRARTACGTSAPSNEGVLTIGGGAPPPVNLSGRWEGTVTSRRVEPFSVDFTHTGTRLAGVAREPGTGVRITFDLTQSAMDGSVYSGAMLVEGSCTQTGSMTVLGPTRMEGTFSRASGCGGAERNDFILTKVQ